MKTKLIFILLICVLLIGCKDNNDGKILGDAKFDKQWEEKTFFDSVYVPDGTINKLSQDYNKDGKEIYTVLINDFSYDKFYEYIMVLESDGFHYDFVNEYVPKKVSDLVDKTETSWSANKDNIYIIANWKSKDNIYYNGYNLQLLFYNYDFTN